MKILYVSTEMRGVVSVGGLAEVVTALVKSLSTRGHDVRFLMPYYACFRQNPAIREKIDPFLSLPLSPGRLPTAQIYTATFEGEGYSIPGYLLSGHPWFDQASSCYDIYPPEYNVEPYLFLCAAVVQFLNDPHNDWIPHIIHCHDYHTGLIPVYLKIVFGGKLQQQPVRTVFTIHNLGFQGKANPSVLPDVGLPASLSCDLPAAPGLTMYGELNCMKGALEYADMVTTVSRTYAQEIQEFSGGKGLHAVLQSVSAQRRLQGIINGIDNEVWNPESLAPPFAFSKDDFRGKDNAKRELQRLCGLESSDDPLIVMRSRWSYQKGAALLIRAITDYNLPQHAQILVVSDTPPRFDTFYAQLWDQMITLAAQHPARIAFIRSNELASLDYAGSDMLLMPSLFEPCGLGQMEAMRYGTLPIVRRTGGIIDTVSPEFGFLFDWHFSEPLDDAQIRYGTECMLDAVRSAMQKYQDKNAWHSMMRKAMMQPNDWSTRIAEYELLYAAVLQPKDYTEITQKIRTEVA